MARMNIILPAMGEGVIEATINKWLVKEGGVVNEDDSLVEVATDKVDSEIPAPSGGTLVEIKAVEGTVVKVGEIIAVIEDNREKQPDEIQKIEKEVERIRETINSVREEKKEETIISRDMKSRTQSGKFLTPLVRSIAAREGISYDELDRMKGSGMDGRITRDDVLRFVKNVKTSERKKKSLPSR